MRKHAVICFAALATLSIAGTAAHAKGAVCQRVQAEMIAVDGMTDDWEDLAPTNYGHGSDAAVALRCAYDATNLFIAVAVRDERLVRTKKGKAKSEDRIMLSIASGTGKALRFGVLPGGKRAPRKALGIPSYVEIEDSLQPSGFFVEMAIPMKRIPGWSATLPYLSSSILFHDVDQAKGGSAQSVVGVTGKLHFSEAASTYRSFMKATGLKNSDVRLDALADVDTGAGAERVIVGGTVLGLLGTSFSYMGLPITSASDLLSAKVVDFDGSGRSAVLTELRQHGNGGSRNVVIVWFAKGDGSFHPALTVETRKQRGDSFIQNSWALVPRGRHRGSSSKKRRKAPKGFDLLMQVGEVEGFSQTNFHEALAADAKNILLPWEVQASALYYFEGTVSYGGEEATTLPKPSRSKTTRPQKTRAKK